MSRRKISGRTRSVQATFISRTNTTINAGRTSGKATDHHIRGYEAPSMRAASKRSRRQCEEELPQHEDVERRSEQVARPQRVQRVGEAQPVPDQVLRDEQDRLPGSIIVASTE